MSVVTLGKDDPKLSHDEIKTLASKAGLTVKEAHLDDFSRLLGALDQSVLAIFEQEDYTPKPDLSAYPRTDIHVPEDTDGGGWALRCVAKAANPKTSLLKGKTLALKDNIALAGMKCTNGTAAVDWTPDIDATLATRIMDAGGIIMGKAACENACLEGVSDTSVTGKVHNPYARGYSCGGSSSGSARLVATGSVDMAIGCDQGGSIRIPASMCGLVGLKPTWGLVPYTGILSLECTIDHAGPITRTVREAALLLEAIAGPDEVDDRQPVFLPDGMLECTSKLDEWLAATASDKASSSSNGGDETQQQQQQPLSGLRIGILSQAFTIPNMDPNISSLCQTAVANLRALGASTPKISIPAHTNAGILWMCSIPLAGARQGLLGDMSGRKQLYLTDRLITPAASTSGETGGKALSQTAFDALGPGAQNLYLRYLYLYDKYGPALHAKTSNLLRKLTDDYDRALRQECDLLVMPTLPSPACKLFEDEAANHGPLERLGRNVGLVGNTAPFNSTGHPALTIPVGFVPAQDESMTKLPVGLQIVGSKFADLECLKVGAAYERAFDWKKEA